MVTLRQRLKVRAGLPGGYTVFPDLDGSARVDVVDVTLARLNVGRALPPTTFVAAGSWRGVPTVRERYYGATGELLDRG